MPANSDSTCSASLTSQTTSTPGSRSAVTTSAPRRSQLVGEGRADASAATRDDDPLAGDGHASAAERVVDVPVRGQYVGQPGPEVERPAVERLDPSARLRDQQGAGADIPRVGRVGLQEGVDAAGGDERQAQRRRADAPNAPASASELGDALSERGDRPRIVGLHAGAHERLVEGRRRRDVQPVVPDPCPAASRRREQLPAERLEDRRRGDALGVSDGDRRARQRHAVGVVGRSVEWVDEPGVAALGSAGAALLPEDRVRESYAVMTSTIAPCAARSVSVTMDVRSLLWSTWTGLPSPSTSTAPPARAAATATSSSSAGDALNWWRSGG